VANKTEGLKVQRILFLAFFAALFLLVAQLFKPFFSILLWASLLYGLTNALYRRATIGRNGKVRGKQWRTVMALAFSIGSMIMIVVPITLLSMVLIGQVQDFMSVALKFLEHGEEFLRSDGFANSAAKLAELSGGSLDLRSVDLTEQVASFLTKYSERIIGVSAGLLRNMASFVVTLAFFLFVLFYLYLDGKELLLMLMNAIPLRNAYTVSFMRKFLDTGKDLVIGYVLMALFQGAMALAVYWIMKVPAPLPLALLSSIASLIPLVGAGLVWFPLVLLRFASGAPGEALLLMALSLVFISSLDNFIRPLILHSRMKLHPLLIFISIIGGIQFLGFNGLLLGPIILALFFTAVDMFGQAYGKPGSGGTSTADQLEEEPEIQPS